MENGGQVSTAWLLNKAIKTINLKTNDKPIVNPTIEEIKEAIIELECARRCFDTVDTPDLIDYAIYREKAAVTRLSYLIKKVKYELANSPNI